MEGAFCTIIRHSVSTPFQFCFLFTHYFPAAAILLGKLLLERDVDRTPSGSYNLVMHTGSRRRRHVATRTRPQPSSFWPLERLERRVMHTQEGVARINHVLCECGNTRGMEGAGGKQRHGSLITQGYCPQDTPALPVSQSGMGIQGY